MCELFLPELRVAAAHTLTITDNDVPPSVQWSAASQSVGEGAGTATITAQLSAVSGQAVTVPYTVNPASTAANPADYTLAPPSPLTIPAGSLSASITVTLVDDPTDEVDETVVVDMGAPTNATIGATTTHTLTITDNDPPPTVQWTAASQSASEGAGTATITAQLSAASTFAVTVPYTVNVSSTAANPADYTLAPASPLTIAPGATTASITVTIVDDGTNEADETVVVDMGAPTNATLGATTTHTLTITDNDTAPTVQWTAASQSVNEGAGTATITAQLSAVSGQNVTVPYTVNVSSTAANPADYTLAPVSPLTIAAGATTASITVTIVDDTADEADETVVVDLGAPTNATLGATTTHTLTITDNDAPPTVQWSAASQNVGEGAGTATITAQLSVASGQTVTVPYTVNVASTAANPADYTLAPASPLTIAPGATTASITVTIVDDITDEVNETVVVDMGAPTNATLGATTTHTLTITDNDAAPTVQWTAASQSVGEGAGTATITAQLSAVSSQTVTVPYTVNVSSTAANPADYTLAPASPLTIAAGATTASITVTIVDDGIDEADETVVVDLGAPTNATLGATTTHTLTITDNDAAPTVQWTAASQSVAENVAGGTATITAQLSAISGQAVTVPYTVNVSSTASNPADYTLAPASPLTIAAGATTASITVTIVDDLSDEPDETVVVDMGVPTNATTGPTTTHTLTITDNDPPPTVQWTAASQSVAENVAGGTATVTAHLSATSTNTVTVDFALTGSTATEGVAGDFTTTPTATLAAVGTLSFAPGTQDATVTVTINNDTIDEPDQTVVLTLQNPANATLGATKVHTLTITDDDPAPSVKWTATTSSITEGTASPGNQVTLTAQLSGASEQTATVKVATGGSASDGTDYTRVPNAASPFTLTFNPGVTTQTVVVTVTDDSTGEPDESATFTLQAPLSNVTLDPTPANLVHTLTIVDNDPIATPDSYNATGNVLLTVPATAETPGCAQAQTDGLLCNDVLRGATIAKFGPTTGLETNAGIAGASAQGGNLTVNANGGFTYNPPPGFTGTGASSDSFFYTLTNAGGSSTAKVTIAVTGDSSGNNLIWFVDANQATNGDGRLTAPFNTLANFQAVNGDGAAAHPKDGDYIFLYESATNYIGPVTLRSGQTLLGQDATANIGGAGSVSGIVPPAGSSALPTSNSANGTIAQIVTSAADVDAVTLSSGSNTVRGLTVGNTSGTGSKIASGASFGTLTISEVSLNGTGQALDLTGGTLSGSLLGLTSSSGTNNNVSLATIATSATFDLGSGALSGAGSDAFKINGGAGSFTYSGTIANTTALAINVANKTGGTVALSGNVNTVASPARGVSFTGNNASTVLTLSGLLSISSGANAGFTATGGGTVTATNTSNTITTTTATALNVANTTIGAGGLKFQTITAGTGASGPASGIILNTTGAVGSLTVSGTGAANSGGVIQHTSGDGISLASTLSPSFDRMNIHDTAGSGVQGTGVTNFSFTNSTVDISGTGGGTDDSNLAFNASAAGTETNLSGTVTITGNSLTNSRYHGIDILNFGGTVANVTLSSNTITSSTVAANTLGSGIRLQASGSAGTVANITQGTVGSNVISNFPSASGILINCGNPNTGGTGGHCGTPGGATVSVTGNTIKGQNAGNPMGSNAIAVALTGGNSGSRSQANYDVSGNGTVANPLANFKGTGVACSVFAFSTGVCTVSSNVMVANNIVASRCISVGADRVFGATDTPDITATISSNNVSACDGNDIFTGVLNSTGTAKIKVQNNTLAAPLTGNRAGIQVNSGTPTAPGTDTTLCLNISGNTSGGSGVSTGIGLRKEGTDPAVNSFAVNGMAATASPGVESFVDGLNPAGNGTTLSSATSGFTNCSLP